MFAANLVTPRPRRSCEQTLLRRCGAGVLSFATHSRYRARCPAVSRLFSLGGRRFGAKLLRGFFAGSCFVSRACALGAGCFRPHALRSLSVRRLCFPGRPFIEEIGFLPPFFLLRTGDVDFFMCLGVLPGVEHHRREGHRRRGEILYLFEVEMELAEYFRRQRAHVTFGAARV